MDKMFMKPGTLFVMLLLGELLNGFSQTDSTTGGKVSAYQKIPLAENELRNDVEFLEHGVKPGGKRKVVYIKYFSGD